MKLKSNKNNNQSSIIDNQLMGFMLNQLHTKRSTLSAAVYPREQLLWPATGGSLSSTSVENLLQISLFLTNKPNVKIGKISLSIVMIKYYDSENRKMNSRRHKNKPNSNPIQTQYKPNIKPIWAISKPNKAKFYPGVYPRELLPRLVAGECKLTLLWSLPSGVLTCCSAGGRGQTQFKIGSFFLFFTFLCSGYNLKMQTWTIQKLLNWITEYLTDKGIDSPRLSAELLLSNIVGLKRIELYTQFDRVVQQEQLGRLRDLVKRAGQNEPIAYLVGRTEFYSLEINVTPDCMIPRPETELLVERAIEFLRTRLSGVQFVCDLCTGSGCIAVAIARNFTDARIIATDICDAALAVAAENVKKHHLSERITLLCGDLFDPIISGLDVNQFDLIVCNPPYVSTAEYEMLDKNVKDYEPKKALLAGVDGLDIYYRVIENAGRFLKSDGALMLEIGYAQGPSVKELLEKTGDFHEIKIEKDFHNNDRIVTARRASA